MTTTSSFPITANFIQDKAHFRECFEASIVSQPSFSLYSKAIMLTSLGFYLVLLTDIETYIAWFIVTLGWIEGLSVLFRKPWWVWRQLLSATAGTKVTLSIDENAIKSQSSVIEREIRWGDITALEKTRKGWLIIHKAGKNYISSECLSAQAEMFFSQRAASIRCSSSNLI